MKCMREVEKEEKRKKEKGSPSNTRSGNRCCSLGGPKCTRMSCADNSPPLVDHGKVEGGVEEKKEKRRKKETTSFFRFRDDIPSVQTVRAEGDEGERKKGETLQTILRIPMPMWRKEKNE